MKNFVEEYGKAIIVAILIIALILVATLFATEGKGSMLNILRHLRGPSYEMITSPSTVKPGEDATFVSSAPFDKFNEVCVDGKALDPDNYTASGESTKIRLKGSYTETLDEGKHTIEIISNDGYAEAEFKVLSDPSILITGSNFLQKIPSSATSVIFTDAKAPDGAALTDVSEAQDGSIVAWLDGTTYKVSTQESGEKVYANPDSSNMFNGNENATCKNLTSIDVTNLDTFQTTDMSYMFRSAGESVNAFTIKGLSSLDTSHATTMKSMFNFAGKNASTFTLDLSRWNTSQVTNMSYMFGSAGYRAGTWSVGDLSRWDTSKLTDAYGMFQSAGKYAGTWDIGDLSGWDTSKVTNMSYMFYNAGYSVSTFIIEGLSSWNTSQVTNMSYMFKSAGCKANTCNIGDLSGWDTAKVKNMSNMFYYAGNNANTLSIGDLSGWDTSRVANMSSMFEYAGSNASTWQINCSSWNVNKVTNYSSFNLGVESKVTAPTWVN